MRRRDLLVRQRAGAAAAVWLDAARRSDAALPRLLRHGRRSENSSGSYAHIASALERPAAEVLFISDVTAELSAARTAGLQVLLSLRPGNPMQPAGGEFESIRGFDEVEVG